MYGRRAKLSALVLASALFCGVLAGSPTAALAAPGDVAVIGDAVAASSQSAGYSWFGPGPVAGTPVVDVDATAGTTTVSVDDGVTGARASVTMAWPARPGAWPLDFNGPDPEQTVKLTRGTAGCTFTGGTLTVRRAEVSATGGVLALSADVTGSCSISLGGRYAGAAIRIGDTDPARAVSIPRATPSTVSTGALTGTLVTHRITVANAGARPWRISGAATASRNSWYPLFKVVAGGDQCTGLTLATGQSCTVEVAATARNYTVWEHLVIAGDGTASLLVPITLEGYDSVEPPTAVVALPGRLSATLSWQPPTTLPRQEYRVYDVSSTGRSIVATAPASATKVDVPGSGSRHLAVVAANGRWAESPDAPVDVPGVSSELVANDWYGPSVAVATDAALPPRQLEVERADLDPSRSRWVSGWTTDLRICPAATGACTTVPGTTGTTDATYARDAAWLADGTIAFLRGSEETSSLWVVRPDGAGLRKVANVPDRGQLAAAPNGTEVLLRNYGGAAGVDRVRLSDGRITAVPGTQGLDDFTVSNQGLLVVERRDDMTTMNGHRTITVMNLDGSAARRLTLPVGDNREAVFDPTGTRVAFARYTGDFEATLWVAAADGSGARQLSDLSRGWLDLKWSVDDQFAPTATVSAPAYTTRTATLAVGAADRDDATGSLRRECRLDAAPTFSPCGPTLTLSALTAGQHTLAGRVIDPSGKESPTVSRSWVVDAVPPTAALAALASAQLRSSITLLWTAADSGGAGPAGYDVRARTAAPWASLGTYQYPASWQKLTTRSLTVSFLPGYQYCFSVRARDRAGNVGAWSGERCTSMPLDDRALTASSGWTRGSLSSYLYGTYSRTLQTGTQLSRASVRARRIAVVATTCPTCGSIDVYHAGVKLGRVSLYSGTTATRQVKWLPLQPVTRTGTVTVRSVGVRLVLIDGLVVFH